MEISLILDVVLIIFLAITIGYAIILNKRLGSLRKDKNLLEKIALNFHDSTERAEQSIKRLKMSGESLMTTISKAETLRDDLVFLSERGGRAADRLENAIRSSRDKAGEQVTFKTPNSQISQDLDKGEDKESSDKLNGHGVAKKLANTKLAKSQTELNKERPGEEISEEERELLRALRSAS